MLLLDHLIPYSLKIGTTRLKSLLRKIPRTITRAGGDTFPSGLLYKPLFLVFGGISRSEKTDLEIIQQSACHIILGDLYSSYKGALKTLNLDSLEARRN